MSSTEATIFLSGSRHFIQDKSFRSYQTLSSPFFSLKAFNDETLAPGSRVNREAGTNSRTVLLPLVGELGCNAARINPGQALLLESGFEVVNPYKEELINYIRMEIDSTSQAGIADFDLDAAKDTLITVFPGMQIGKFGGRRDGLYTPDQGTPNVFVFVIEGVFEVQDRLLHARDGLALLNVAEVAFEALSNEAILLTYVA